VTGSVLSGAGSLGETGEAVEEEAGETDRIGFEEADACLQVIVAVLATNSDRELPVLPTLGLPPASGW
jgi:hypothetical protein